MPLYGVKDKRAVVVAFLSFECPVSNSYATDLADLARAYEKRGVAFLAVNSNDEGDGTEIAKRADEYKLPFLVLMDDKHTAAGALKAAASPRLLCWTTTGCCGIEVALTTAGRLG